MIFLGSLSLPVLGEGIAVADGDFRCMLDMEPVRGFYPRAARRHAGSGQCGAGRVSSGLRCAACPR